MLREAHKSLGFGLAALLSSILSHPAISQSERPGTSAPRSTTKVSKRGPSNLAKLWTPQIESSVERGLAWLAKTQQPTGCFLGTVGHKRSDSYMVFTDQAKQARARQGHVGVTSLAGMAFLAGGHLPNRGKYGKQVAQITDYLLSRVGEDGFVTDSGTRMYSHAFATLFLAEVYGIDHNRRIKAALEKATHIIVDCQNIHGAWRYNPFSKEADLSVTVCQLQALRAARNVGIRIPVSCIDRAVQYVRDSQTDSQRAKGLFYYKIHGRGAYQKNTQFAINAAAVTALNSAGIYERKLLAPAIDFLLDEVDAVQEWYPHHFYFWYGNYYACQALYHSEGLVRDRCFRDYYRGIKKHLLADQRPDGRWLNDVGPGDAFGTAVACIVLQVPKQYLPIFQR